MGFTRSFLRVLALGALGSCLALVIARADVAVQRFAENPLVSVRSDPSVGDNVNGPSVIKVPSWVKRPLGKYYMSLRPS